MAMPSKMPYKDMTPAEQEALAAKGQSGASGKNEEGVGGLERWQGKNPLDKSSTRPTTERITLPADTGKEQPFRPEDKPWDEQLLAARKEVNQSKMSPAQRAAAQEKLAKGGQGGGSGRTLPSGDALREPKPLETPKEFKEKPEEPKGSPEHTYTYEQSGDSHQVTVRDPEGKSVALITAREEKPGIWTTKFSASSEHGEGFKGYTRLMDAAKAEAQRSGKPVTVRGDDEMTPAAVRTWGKLGDSYDISWNKEHRPSVTFRPTKMNAEGSKMK